MTTFLKKVLRGRMQGPRRSSLSPHLSFLALFAVALFAAAPAHGQAGRIYTKTDPANTGGITGHVPLELTHAIAVQRDCVSVFLATLDDGGKAFRFEHLPIGKYDLVLISKGGIVFEGLALGDAPSGLSAQSLASIEKRYQQAETFFKKYLVHRTGLSNTDSDGDALFRALLERYRSNDILKQDGTKLNETVRRIEIMELHQATDDWQMVSTRVIYREAEPDSQAPSFFKHSNVAQLGNIRVIDSPKDLGEIHLPSNP